MRYLDMDKTMEMAVAMLLRVPRIVLAVLVLVPA